MALSWTTTRDQRTGVATRHADVDGLHLTITEEPALDSTPVTLTVEWVSVASKRMPAHVAYRVAERVADAFSRLTFPVAGMVFTPAQVTTMVDAWEELTTNDRVTGETEGYYRHSTAYLSPGVSGPTGNVNRMPNRAEIYALVIADGEECAYPVTEDDDENPWSHFPGLTPITLTLISCGDYHGTDVDAANNRTLDGMPGVDVSYPGTGGMGSVESISTTQLGSVSAFAVAETEGATATPADVLRNLRALVDTIGGLDEYGLLSEEDHGKYVREQAEQWWENGLESDVMSTLEDMTPDGDDTDPRDRAEDVKAAYFDFDDTYWQIDGPNTATNVHNANHADAVKHVAETVFGWTPARAER